MTSLFPWAMALTNFGESTVVFSTAMAISGWFWLSHQRQLAALWLLAIGGCAVSMVVLKLIFLTCGHLVLDGSLRTPSGHSSMAALFYGAAALTVERILPTAARHRTLMTAGAFIFALLIAFSRIVIHAHSLSEVVTGLLVGFVWLCCFALMLGRVRASVQMPPTFVLCLLATLYGGLLALTMLGEHMTVEGLLNHVADLLQTRWDVCVR
jgi:membrane-associated phospholipid phosphatase